MARNKRELQEINGGPMADIAFLLLIFFLVTTQISTDAGLIRKLPPIPPEEIDVAEQEVNERNALIVLVNRFDQILADDKRVDISNLKEVAKEFIQNQGKKENLPVVKTLAEVKAKAKKDEKPKKYNEASQALELLGNMEYTPNHVISLQNDRGTSYQAYINVQNELTAAYNELRNQLARNRFNKDFDDLSEEKQEAIKFVYPMAVSEAEPVEY